MTCPGNNCSCVLLGTAPVVVSPDLEVSITGTDPSNFVLASPEGQRMFTVPGPTGITDLEALVLTDAVAVTVGVPHIFTLEWKASYTNVSGAGVASLLARAVVAGTVFQPDEERQEGRLPQTSVVASRVGHDNLIWQIRLTPAVTPVTLQILARLSVAGMTADLERQILITETRQA